MTDELKKTDGETESELAALLAIFWRRRGIVAACAGAALLLALIYLHTTTYTYTVTLNVVAAEGSGEGGLLSKLGGLSSLAPLAGINLGGMQNSSFQLYIEGLQSREAAEELAKHDDLMHVIFAHEWDTKAHQWRAPAGIAGAIKSGVFSLLGAEGRGWRAPDGARLKDYLDTKLSIVQSTRKQIVAINFNHRDPAFAASLLSTLHSVVDERVRHRTLLRADENIAYLAKKLDTVINVEHQRALAQALSEQEKLRMMASSNAAFAAEPFGPPNASPRPTRPMPMQVVAVALLLGSAAGAMLALFLSRNRGSVRRE